jgi:hypothetical protein
MVRAESHLNLRERQSRTWTSTTEIPGTRMGLPQSSALLNRSAQIIASNVYLHPAGTKELDDHQPLA